MVERSVYVACWCVTLSFFVCCCVISLFMYISANAKSALDMKYNMLLTMLPAQLSMVDINSIVQQLAMKISSECLPQKARIFEFVILAGKRQSSAMRMGHRQLVPQ